jgi:hypothetical protein
MRRYREKRWDESRRVIQANPLRCGRRTVDDIPHRLDKVAAGAVSSQLGKLTYFRQRGGEVKAIPAFLSQRRRVLNATGVPQLVEAPGNAELRARAHIALINFTVIADVANNARGPILGEAKLLAVSALGAD